MRSCFRTSVAGWLVAFLAVTLVCGSGHARKRKRGGRDIVINMQVGETQEFDARHFKSPKVQRPAIVGVKRCKNGKCYYLTAKKRGKTVVTFTMPVDPKGRKKTMKLRLKIVVR